MALKPELVRRILRFAIVGATVMLFFTGLNALLGRWMGATTAFLLAYPPAIALHFFLNKWWTFGCARTDTGKQVSEYLAMVLLTFVVQYGFFQLAHAWLGLPGWMAAGLANGAQMALSFGLMQRHVFAPAAAGEPAARTPGRIPWLVIGVLLVSLGLRVALAWGGGQLFWGDEQIRYGSAQTAYLQLVEGRWADAAREIFGHADHPLFRLWSLPAAALEYHFAVPKHAAAIYFSAFSAVALWLIWRIALRAGASEREALLALVLAAAANSLFFYARHLLPYDIALCWMLGALWLGLGSWSARRSGATGLLVGIGFLTYSGYWLLGATVLILHVVRAGGGGWRRTLVAAAAAGGGLAGVIGGWLGAGWGLDYGLADEFRRFAGSVTQGDFGQGYRVVAEYFWAAEGGMLVIWLAGVASAIAVAWREREVGRLGWWWAGALLMLGGLVFFSDVIPKFVIYGRLARCVVPFVCLAAAAGIVRWSAPSRRLAVVVVVGLAAMNFAGPLRQVFPDRFHQLVWQRLQGHLEESSNVYRIVRGEHSWTATWREPLPAHEVLLRRAHPLEFRPYLFEGFNRAERERLLGHDLSMRLIRLGFSPTPGGVSGTENVWGRYPGPVRLTFRLPVGRIGRAEPLLSAGGPRQADFLFIKYVDQERIQIGYDHWGSEPVLSPPLLVDPAAEQTVVVSTGSLYPAPDESGPAQESLAAELRSRLIVLLNGALVFSVPAPSFPTRPGAIQYGTNLWQGTSSETDFTGQLLRVAREPVETVLPFVPSLALRARRRGPEWSGAIGPTEITLDLSRIPRGTAEPVVALDAEAGRSLLFVERTNTGHVRVGYERLGGNVLWSEPLSVGEGEFHRLAFSLGGLMPEPGAPLYEQIPMLLRLRELVHVRFDGATVLTALQDDPGKTRAVSLGSNGVRSSVTRADLTANVARIEPLDALRFVGETVMLSTAVDRTDAGWLGWPGPIRLQLRFPQHRIKQAEPLLVRGVPGAGDILFVHYVDERSIRFGLDHWGSGGPVSEPIAVDLSEPHEVVIAADMLMPPGAGAGSDSIVSRLRKRLVVMMDGKVVLRGEGEAHPAALDSLTLGTNFIGGSTAGPVFTGSVLRVEPLSLEDSAQLLEGALP